jgi:hypothetical protein
MKKAYEMRASGGSKMNRTHDMLQMGMGIISHNPNN